VTEDWADPEGAGLLGALGQVEPPEPSVLEAAREALWSAVTGEMLSAGPAASADKTSAARTDAGRAGAPGTDRSREDLGRRRAEPGS
jgi:hypothetical protein